MLNPNLKIDPVTQSPSHPKGAESSPKPIVAVRYDMVLRYGA